VKHLPKHLRPRWRYLAVELETWPGAAIDRRAVQRALWYAGRALLGDPGSAATDLTVIAVDFESTAGVGWAIVRVRREAVTRGRAAIACLDTVDGQPVRLRVRGVSGTIRACKEKHLGRDGQLSEERDVVFQTEATTAVVRDGSADVRLGDGFLGATHLDLT
jgi:ribonuclease P/MRP protein subunit POP5